jgi:hypothetical protein
MFLARIRAGCSVTALWELLTLRIHSGSLVYLSCEVSDDAVKAIEASRLPKHGQFLC